MSDIVVHDDVVVIVVVVGIADWNDTATTTTSPTGTGFAVGQCAGGFVGSCC